MVRWDFMCGLCRLHQYTRRQHLLILTTMLLLFQVTQQQQIIAGNRQCSVIYDQEIDEKSMSALYMSSVLSAIAYLEYEKDPTQHPWKVDFESTGQATFLSTLKIKIRRTLCQMKLRIRNVVGFFRRYLDRILWNSNEENDIPNYNAKATDISHTGLCNIEEKIAESFKFRWFFADWREGLWHDTEVLLGESETTAVIAFRGSDTAADLFTNSQTMEPAMHSYYFGHQEGQLLPPKNSKVQDYKVFCSVVLVVR